MRFERCTSGQLLRSGPARAQDSVTARQGWRVLTLVLGALGQSTISTVIAEGRGVAGLVV
jgi:hypothetical protein